MHIRRGVWGSREPDVHIGAPGCWPGQGGGSVSRSGVGRGGVGVGQGREHIPHERAWVPVAVAQGGEGGRERVHVSVCGCRVGAGCGGRK